MFAISTVAVTLEEFEAMMIMKIVEGLHFLLALLRLEEKTKRTNLC